MDQDTFTNLTGLTVATSQEGRFNHLLTSSGEDLEEVLGYPLDPTDWEDQYEEIGKTANASWNGDLDALAEPDEVEGSTRLYRWNRYDPNLFIDPATHLHSIKLVRMDSYGSDDGNGVTFQTLDPKGYTLLMKNGRDGAWGKYVRMTDDVLEWRRDLLWFQWPSLWSGDEGDEYVQVAVDADWAFEELPSKLLQVQADMIAYSIDDKRDIKSESMLGHSYTRDTRKDPMQQHASVLSQYAGPNGSVGNELVIA